MLPTKRSAVFLFSLCLAAASIGGTAQAQTNPLCQTRGHGPTLCPDLGSTGGDVFNPYYNPRVRALQGTAVSPLGPLPGQFFQNVGGIWTPVTFSASGDISGAYPTFVVGRIQGFPVSSVPPALNQVLQWNGTAYFPATLPVPPSTGQDIYMGGDFTALNPLAPLVPQYFAFANPNFTQSLTPGLMVRTGRTANQFLVGASSISATGSITFDLLMSTDDGASYPLVATATVAAGTRVGFSAMALPIPTNARLLVRATTSALLTFIGGLSATVASP